MNPHALDVLEFRTALDRVAVHAASPAGADAVRSLEPVDDVARIRAELALVAEGMTLVGREGGWPMPTFPEIRDALRKLRLEGYAWDGPTLRQTSALIAAARATRSLLGPLREQLPGLGAISETIEEFAGIPEAIDRVIGEDGEVRDNASPDLARIRREMQGARNRIVARLTEFMAGLAPHHQVPDASVTIREGRYVVPVRREGRGEIGGIVHGESQTGATLFVEPPLAIEMMNRLRELEGEEAREIHRLLLELTGRVRPHADALEWALDALIRIDSIHARARYAASIGGHPPDVLELGDELRIYDGRHPILLAGGEAVVPFDLSMEKGERTLVISGPNTGGKTVLLKAIGLISLLTQSGVVPPVGPDSRLPVFSDVFADIGDEQSIEASLSTFSAHLRNLRETLEGADSGSLVLVDEVGSGTDPVEGAALATAIISELTERGCFTVATTHLGELKLLATEDSRIVNASLQFDSELLEPTYRLVKGVPGRSYGLAIARRLGLPENVLGRAESALPRGERDVARLLLELEAKEQRVAELEMRLTREVEEAEALRAELENRQRELTRREKDAERRARQQARDLLLQSRAEVEAAIEEVRSAADEQAMEEAARAARRRVEEAARRQRERTPAEKRSRRPRKEAHPGELVVGARVRVESLRRTGTLLELRDSRAIVDTGGIRLQLAADDLTMLPPGDQNAAKSSAPSRRPAGGHIDANFEASHEIDLRGLRAADIGLQLNRAIDNAILAGLPTFRIIHGKGTGALRHEVEVIVRDDPRILAFRPGDRFEGGTGVTVVEFA